MSLKPYAAEYVSAFNRLISTLPETPYTKPLIEARIFYARDAAVIYYLPDDVQDISPNFLPQGYGGFFPLHPGGVSESAPNNQSLTVVLQSATFNHLKVGEYNLIRRSRRTESFFRLNSRRTC